MVLNDDKDSFYDELYCVISKTAEARSLFLWEHSQKDVKEFMVVSDLVSIIGRESEC